MKKISKVIIAIAAALCIVFAAGCKKDGPKPILIQKPQSEAKIVLGATDLSLKVGDEYKLGFVLRGSEESVTFASSNTAVATVSADGLIRATDIGNAVITAKVGAASATCIVAVSASPVFGISADKNVIMLVGGEYPLNVSLSGGKIDGVATFSYASAEDSVAEVSDTGVVKAVSVGKTDIIVSAVCGGKTAYEKVAVTVTENAWIDVAEKIEVTLAQGDIEVDYAVRDSSGDIIQNAVAVVSVQESSVATVAGNFVKPKKCGKTTLNIVYGQVRTEIELEVSLGVGEDEYNCFLDTPALENVRAGNCSNQNWFPANVQPVAAVIENKTLKDKSGNMLKISSAAISNANKSVKYVGVALPCRKSKVDVQTLKSNGYNKLVVEYYLETADLSWFQMCAFGKKENNAAKESGVWKTMSIGIDTIIDNYEELATGDKPLIYMFSGDNDNNIPYTVYISALKFAR